MDDIIKKILEIEERAKQIVEDANCQKEKMDEEIKKEIDKMKEELQQRAKRKIQQIREKEMKEAHKKVSEIEEQSKRQLEAITVLASNKKKEWETMVINRIVGR
ncbi:MAG: hypothetical protein GX066_07405 [Clostridiaceae bacterium]|nr:hypothetical protein [Clostridiaceae bacterium]